jgi:hypothetical protein
MSAAKAEPVVAKTAAAKASFLIKIPIKGQSRFRRLKGRTAAEFRQSERQFGTGRQSPRSQKYNHLLIL